MIITVRVAKFTFNSTQSSIKAFVRGGFLLFLKFNAAGVLLFVSPSAFESVLRPALPLRVRVQFDFQALKRQLNLFLDVIRCYSPQKDGG